MWVKYHSLELFSLLSLYNCFPVVCKMLKFAITTRKLTFITQKTFVINFSMWNIQIQWSRTEDITINNFFSHFFGQKYGRWLLVISIPPSSRSIGYPWSGERLSHVALKFDRILAFESAFTKGIDEYQIEFRVWLVLQHFQKYKQHRSTRSSIAWQVVNPRLSL